MTWQRAVAWYAIAGISAVLLAGMIGGLGAAGAAAVAWTLCLAAFVAPPLRPRVAAISVTSKISREQRIWFAAMPARMLVVLVGSALLYTQLGDRLGVGFWFAVLAFYLIALALSLARTLTDLKRNA